MPGRRDRRSNNKFAQRRIIPAKMPEDLLIEEWDAITDEIRRFKEYDESGGTKALRDEKRWEIVRADHAHEAAAALYDGLRDIETVLTSDQIADIDARIGGPKGVTP